MNDSLNRSIIIRVYDIKQRQNKVRNLKLRWFNGSSKSLRLTISDNVLISLLTFNIENNKPGVYML
jgi:hypothetical protein